MKVLISLIVLIILVIVGIWLVDLLTLPSGLAILKPILKGLIVIIGIIKLIGFINSSDS